MTGRIIPMRGDPHERIVSLLPWYVTGRLDADERAEVEAHLKGCEACRAEEVMERRVAADLAALSGGSGEAWTGLRARVSRAAPRKRSIQANPRSAPADVIQFKPVQVRTRWLGVAVGLQAALFIGGLIWFGAQPASKPGTVRSSAAVPVGRDGDLAVTFNPRATEETLRAALLANQARIVDGPSAAGAYRLRVQEGRQAAVLADLRRRPEVISAQAADLVQVPR